MSKTVIKNSKVVVRRVVGELPFGIACSATTVKKCSDEIQACIDKLNKMAPYYEYPFDDIPKLLEVLASLYHVNATFNCLFVRLKDLHKSLNPESLGLEVID